MKARLGSGRERERCSPSLATVPADQNKDLPILETTKVVLAYDADFFAVDNDFGEQTSAVFETEDSFRCVPSRLPDP